MRVIHISRIVAGKRHKLAIAGESPERIRLRRTLQNSVGIISGALSALAYERSVLPFVRALREGGQRRERRGGGREAINMLLKLP